MDHQGRHRWDRAASTSPPPKWAASGSEQAGGNRPSQSPPAYERDRTYSDTPETTDYGFKRQTTPTSGASVSADRGGSPQSVHDGCVGQFLTISQADPSSPAFRHFVNEQGPWSSVDDVNAAVKRWEWEHGKPSNRSGRHQDRPAGAQYCDASYPNQGAKGMYEQAPHAASNRFSGYTGAAFPRQSSRADVEMTSNRNFQGQAWRQTGHTWSPGGAEPAFRSQTQSQRSDLETYMAELAALTGAEPATEDFQMFAAKEMSKGADVESAAKRWTLTRGPASDRPSPEPRTQAAPPVNSQNAYKPAGRTEYSGPGGDTSRHPTHEPYVRRAYHDSPRDVEESGFGQSGHGTYTTPPEPQVFDREPYADNFSRRPPDSPDDKLRYADNHSRHHPDSPNDKVPETAPRKVPQDAQTKGNITGTDFYRDPNSATYYKLDKTGKLKVNGGNPVRESGKCHPSNGELQSLKEHKPQRRFEDPWIQEYAFCNLQLFVVLALFAAAIAYAVYRVRGLRGSNAHPNTPLPPLAYAAVVLAVELMGMVTLLFYAAHTTCVPTPFMPKGSQKYINERPSPEKKYNIRVLVPCYNEDDAIIKNTVAVAAKAEVPPGCTKSVYLCNDYAKAGEQRDAWINQPADVWKGPVYYVSRPSGRQSDSNPKSVNVDWCLNQIFGEYILAGKRIPDTEIICILDADQAVHSDFFLRTVHLLDGGENVGMVLTPQPFTNLDPAADIFGHANAAFWFIMQPFYQVLGLISCTGTNFLLRAEAWRHCGGFPTYTLTEDFALGLELTLRGWKCRYIPDELVEGNAPERLSQVFKQRGRWAQGHFQMFCNWRYNPLFRFIFRVAPIGRYLWGLLLGLWFCSGVFAYISTILGAPLLVLVPLLNFWTGIFPVALTRQVGVAGIFYTFFSVLVIFHCPADKFQNFGFDREKGVRRGKNLCFRLRALWLGNMSNNLLWFCYLKAMFMATYAVMTGKSLAWKVTGGKAEAGNTGDTSGKDTGCCSCKKKTVEIDRDRFSLMDVWFPIIAYGALLASMVLAIIAMIQYDKDVKSTTPQTCRTDPSSLACLFRPLNPALGISIGWTFYAFVPNMLAIIYIFWDDNKPRGSKCYLSCCLCCCCPEDGRLQTSDSETAAEKLQVRCQNNWLKAAIWLAMPLSFAAVVFTMLMLGLAIKQPGNTGPATKHPYYYEAWEGILALVWPGHVSQTRQ